jgi:hypothetical protein
VKVPGTVQAVMKKLVPVNKKVLVQMDVSNLGKVVVVLEINLNEKHYL